MRHNDLCAFRQVRCVDGLAVLRVRRNQAQFGAGVAALVWRDATALLLERKIEQRCDLGPQRPIEVHEDGLRDDGRPQPQKDLEHCDHQQRSDYRRGCVGEPPLHLIRDSRCILAVLRWRYQGGKGDRVDRSTGVMLSWLCRPSRNCGRLPQKKSRRRHFGDQPTFIQMSAIRPRATPGLSASAQWSPRVRVSEGLP